MFENMTKKQQKLLSMSTDDDGIHFVGIWRVSIRSTLGSTNEEKELDQVECCICQSSNQRDRMGLVVRFGESGGRCLCRLSMKEANGSVVLGLRPVDPMCHRHPSSSLKPDNHETSAPVHSKTCCSEESVAKSEKSLLDTNSSQSTDQDHMTCAQFYEDKIQKMLKIFPKVKSGLSSAPRHVFFIG